MARNRRSITWFAAGCASGLIGGVGGTTFVGSVLPWGQQATPTIAVKTGGRDILLSPGTEVWIDDARLRIAEEGKVSVDNLGQEWVEFKPDLERPGGITLGFGGTGWATLTRPGSVHGVEIAPVSAATLPAP